MKKPRMISLDVYRNLDVSRLRLDISSSVIRILTTSWVYFIAVTLYASVAIGQPTFIPEPGNKEVAATANALRAIPEPPLPADNRRIILDFVNGTLKQSNEGPIYFVESDDAVSFMIRNINPLRYKIELNKELISHSINEQAAKELRSKFAVPVPTGMAPLADKEKELKHEITLLLTLANELGAFYDNLLNSESYDQFQLEAEKDYLKARIRDKFGLPVTSNALISKLDEILSSTSFTSAATLEYLRKDLTPEKITVVKQRLALLDKIIAVRFSYLSLPVQPGNKDVLKYNLKITKGDETVASESYGFEIYGGWRVNYGTGLFFTSLKDEKFIYQAASPKSDTVRFINERFETTDSILRIDKLEQQKIAHEDNGDFSFGLAVTAHLYYKVNYGILNGIGPTIGIMLDNQVNTRYLLGLSFQFGVDPSFTFSIGNAFGQVERLATGLSTDQLVAKTETSTVPTRKVTLNRFYVGVTFNFGGKSETDGKND